MYRNIIIVGLGKSGFSVLDFFSGRALKEEINITVFDISKNEDQAFIEKIAGYKNAVFHLGENPTGMEEADLVVMSPGISLDTDFVKKFRERDIEITGDIELSYRFGHGMFIGITGTNGKTTTTTLTGEIFSGYSNNTYIVGNIGNPALDQSITAQEDSFLITELSSFQLESIKAFRPHVAAILNISPDHLNRHKTMENYMAAKFRIYENQTEEDYLILNYDDPQLRFAQKDIKPHIVFFSADKQLDSGIFIENEHIVASFNSEKEPIMEVAEIKLAGRHNLENILAATAISVCCGIEADIIRNAVKEFNGVEHRLENVRVINDILYINDSKATNPNSAIKAVEAVKAPIILIAGGMDKGADFSEFIEILKEKVFQLILLGETKHMMKRQAELAGFSNVILVDNMKDAVIQANKTARPHDTVLLSPACASWDMYDNFEKRGMDFKYWVNLL